MGKNIDRINIGNRKQSSDESPVTPAVRRGRKEDLDTTVLDKKSKHSVNLATSRN